jgi:hypothetical protein
VVNIQKMAGVLALAAVGACSSNGGWYKEGEPVNGEFEDGGLGRRLGRRRGGSGGRWCRSGAKPAVPADIPQDVLDQRRDGHLLSHR